MIASEIAGGLLGTVVLTTLARAAAELGLTRVDLPLILGTVVTEQRRKARAVGYLFHAILGVLFAILYGAIFRVLDQSSWQLGALIGIAHAVFLSTVVINVLLPLVHPLMGTPETAANEIALVEPPGFLMLNYGRYTFLVMLVAHMAFGAIVGWAFRM